MRIVVWLILSMIIDIHTHIHTAGLDPVTLKPHTSFTSDASSHSGSSPITDDDLQQHDRGPFARRTTTTPDSSPRKEKDDQSLPPSPPEADVARINYAIAEERHEFDRGQEDRSEQLQHLANLELVRKSLESRNSDKKLEDYRARRDSILRATVNPLAPEVLISIAVGKQRRESEDLLLYAEPSPVGSITSMSPASGTGPSLSSSVASSVAASAATSPKQSPTLRPMASPSSHASSPSRYSPSSHTHRSAAIPYGAPPPLPSASAPKSLWALRRERERGSTMLKATAFNSLSPKSSDKQ